MTVQEQAQAASGQRPVWPTLFDVLFGPIVWAAHLTLIYGLQSVACALASPLAPALIGLDPVQLAIAALTAAALLAIASRAAVARRPAGGTREGELAAFLDGVMLVLMLLSALGIAGQGGAALIIPACPPLR
jgi:hypothetical protein